MGGKRQTSHGISGYNYRGCRCEVCATAKAELAARQYQEDKAKGEFSRWRGKHLKKYGLTPQEYVELLEAQGGVCAICSEVPNGWRLAVDHNHDTGQIRGLLCLNCNNGIGKLGDSIERLTSALSYLLAFSDPVETEAKAEAGGNGY